MKTAYTNPFQSTRATGHEGFTLLDLLVVVGVLSVLIALQMPAWAGGKSQSKIGICASHVRQLALASQIYANDNRDKLPVLSGSASWAWDLPVSVADVLLNSGATTNTFYCPGTAPRFTEKENWATTSSLWNYGGSSGFRTVGYALAFSGATSVLATTKQNTTMLPERITLTSGTVIFSPSERVLVADATLSDAATVPGYLIPGNNYVNVAGGFTQNGLLYPHVSPHLKGVVPVGGNLGFKDGHAAWRKFELMTPRNITGKVFWW